jgi:hypothetical protein
VEPCARVYRATMWIGWSPVDRRQTSPLCIARIVAVRKQPKDGKRPTLHQGIGIICLAVYAASTTAHSSMSCARITRSSCGHRACGTSSPFPGAASSGVRSMARASTRSTYGSAIGWPQRICRRERPGMCASSASPTRTASNGSCECRMAMCSCTAEIVWPSGRAHRKTSSASLRGCNGSRTHTHLCPY